MTTWAKTRQLLRRLNDSPAVVEFVGSKLTADRNIRLAAAICDVLGPRVMQDSVRDSLTELLDEVLTRRQLYQTLWRLAGNYDELARGRVVSAWSRQTKNEWISLEIEEIARTQTAKGRHGYKLYCRALTGSCCPQPLEAYWPQSFFGMARSLLGFSRRHPYRYPFRHWSDLTQMHFEGLLTPELSAEEPKFEKVRVPASMVAENRQLIDMRERRGFECPQGFTHACEACPIGVDGCVAASHPVTYTKKRCSKCEQIAWCDPRHRGTCVECRRKFLEGKQVEGSL